MADDSVSGCPICAGTEWRAVLDGPGFRVDMCASGCICRTVPPPKFDESPIPPPGMQIGGVIRSDKPRSGHFRLAGELLDAVAPTHRSGKLLDIGSGWGHLLKMARDRGYDAVGLEASSAAAGFSREVFDIEPLIGFFPERTLDPASFDIVTLNHVLEHLNDPVGALTEAGRILKPGGVLGVECPNYESMMRHMVGQYWVGLQPLQHVWQLSVRSIGDLVRKAGLEPVVVRTTSQEYVRAGRSLPKWLRLRAMLWAASLVRLGDNAIVIARKPIQP